MNSAKPKEGIKKYLTVSNAITTVLLVLVIAMFVNPNVKAVFIRGLMKVGLFQPNISAPTSPPNSVNSFETASFIKADGIEVSLGELRGKVVFLNFWATWCPPCIAEMPSINELHQKLQGNSDVVFLMVDVDGNRERSQAFLNARGYDMPLALSAGKIPPELFSGTLPSTVVLDKNGNIAMRHEGAADYSSDKMTEFINKLISTKQ
jgi:thiol-disulfide isomerase/thioredoxin